MTSPRLFIIDAMAMIFRCHHAFSTRPLSRSDGHPTSALFGAMSVLSKLIEEERPEYLVCASDSKEKTFRHDLYQEYKAHRSTMPEDLAKQIPHFYEMLEAYGIPVVIQPGFEADDLIGSIVQQFASPTLPSAIVSGDKDFMQLINAGCSLYAQKKGGLIERIDEEAVQKKLGVSPRQVRDYLALTGDSSDNIPGAKGIGGKGAAQLLSKFDTLENLYGQLDRIANERQRKALEESRDAVFLSQQLVTIKTDLHLPLSLDDMRFPAEDEGRRNRLLRFCETWELQAHMKRLQTQIEQKTTSAQTTSIKEKFSSRYETIATPKMFDQFITTLAKQERFSFDTETTGLDPLVDQPIGISLGLDNGYAGYIPLTEDIWGKQGQNDVISKLKSIFDSNQTKIAHNAKFDLHMLEQIGITVSAPIKDSMLAAYALDPTRRSFKLDDLAKSELEVLLTPITDLIGKKKEGSMLSVPLPQLTDYACEDADACLRLYDFFAEKLRVENRFQLLGELDEPLVPLLTKMERAGIQIDVAKLEELSTRWEQELQTLLSQMEKLVGHPFNPQSPKQLQVVMYEEMKIHEALGIKKIKKTKQGFSTDASVLQTMSEHPFIRLLLEYRSIAKLKGTYTESLASLAKEHSSRVHTSFLQTGTETGRLSSNQPNLQNIPIRSERGKSIRSAFVAQKGSQLVSADYSQIELRLFAHMSQDKELLKAFHSGSDIHIWTAATVLDKAETQVTPEERAQAKAVNYGILYGMGARKLAQTTNMSLASAKTFIERYFERFSQAQTYIEQLVETAQEKGYSETLFGRRRLLPGFQQGGLAFVNARNAAINSPIQGGAADLMKIAMLKVAKVLEDFEGTQILLQVHDELVLECPTRELTNLIPLVKQAMENAVKLTVPLEVQIGFGTNWLEAHA